MLMKQKAVPYKMVCSTGLNIHYITVCLHIYLLAKGRTVIILPQYEHTEPLDCSQPLLHFGTDRHLLLI